MTDRTRKAVRLTLIRHGETVWSFSHRHTGETDLALTAHGEAEARKLRLFVAAAHFTHVFSSPRRRARDTCEISGASGAPELTSDAAEWDYGDFEGRRSVDIRLERPAWDIFVDGCPNGEVPSEISARADRVIARISAMPGSIALFTHGQFGLVFTVRWLGLDVLQARHFLLEPSSIGMLSVQPDLGATHVIKLWNAPGDAEGLRARAHLPGFTSG